MEVLIADDSQNSVKNSRSVLARFVGRNEGMSIEQAYVANRLPIVSESGD